MKVCLTHVSTACLLLEIDRTRILTDPVFDTGERRYWAAPLVPFTRSFGPALPPEFAKKLEEIDLVLLSHPHHKDNLDEGGRALLKNAREVVTAAEEANQLRGLRVTKLRAWSQIRAYGRDGLPITITATPALHGKHWLPGVRHVRGFILEWPGQTHGPLWISGDTVYHSEIRQVGERKIGTAILHLGAADFAPYLPSFLRFTFNAADAVKMIGELSSADLKQIIPIHYEQFVWSHFKESVSAYHIAFAKARLLPKLRWLTRGVPTELTI